ncbi:MAG: VPLPA-CTERM sorting domain-containing protein [Syntrophorhabdales bacterium]
MRKVFLFAVCMLLLVAGGARADLLYLGPDFSSPIYGYENGSSTLTSVGGGSIDPSTLNGNPLPWVYCVGLFTTVGVPGTYNNTGVTTNGYVNGALVNNAGAIAWLLANYAQSGQGGAQIALQAAIWSVEYPVGGGGQTYAFDTTTGSGQMNSTASISDYESIMSAVIGSGTLVNPQESGTISNYAWLSPGITGDSTLYQGLVTQSPVPIPAAVWLLGSGLIGLAGIRRRFTK